MKLNRIMSTSLVLLIFSSGAPHSAELDPNISWHTLYTFKAPQESSKAKYEVWSVEGNLNIQSKPLASPNSNVLARLIARAIAPIEIGIWSANSSFLIGLSGAIAVLVEQDTSFHVKNRQTDTGQFPDSMRRPLLNSKSDIEFDVQKTMLNQKLDFKQMEGAI